MKLRVYSDGASRGNPGVSAIAFMILAEDGKLLEKSSRYVGIRTNNQAEYEALLVAFEAASKLSRQEVTCYMDSQLVVKQLKGEYQVKNPELKTLWLKVIGLTKNFQKVSFVNVPRTEPHIQVVDRLVNKTLNSMSNRI